MKNLQLAVIPDRNVSQKSKGVEKSSMCSPPDSIPVLQMFLRLVHAKRAIEVGVYTGTYGPFKGKSLAAGLFTRSLQEKCKYSVSYRGLECCVCTGFVTLGLALALPDDGRVIACDITDEYPSVGRRSATLVILPHFLYNIQYDRGIYCTSSEGRS